MVNKQYVVASPSAQVRPVRAGYAPDVRRSTGHSSVPGTKNAVNNPYHSIDAIRVIVAVSVCRRRTGGCSYFCTGRGIVWHLYSQAFL